MSPQKLPMYAAALLGSSLICPLIAKCALKKMAMQHDIDTIPHFNESYKDILFQETKIIAKDFVTKSLPLGLLLAACTRLGNLPKYPIEYLAILIPIYAIQGFNKALKIRNRIQEIDTPGGLDKDIKIYEI